jgi:hypothetical protein
MAKTKRLKPDAVARITQHLAELLARPHVGITPDKQPKLGESFELFSLDASHISAAADSRVSLRHLIRPTSHWHHQISLNDGTYRFARSKQPDSSYQDWAVQCLLSSPLAAATAKAVERIDQERPADEIEACLIFAPAYRVHAFLLETATGCEVFVVDSPYLAACV